MLKCLQVAKEIRGHLWHSWAGLRDRGLPHDTEVASNADLSLALCWFHVNRTTASRPVFFPKFTCTTQGTLARLQSRAQVVVEGRSLLTSGLNVSTSDGRLSLLLSVSPPASNQTQPSLAAILTAQLKGSLDFCEVVHI